MIRMMTMLMLMVCSPKYKMVMDYMNKQSFHLSMFTNFEFLVYALQHMYYIYNISQQIGR